MTLHHGTYLLASRQIDDMCPVVVGDWPCCLKANHYPLECQYFDATGSRRLGVVPAPNSIAMHDPVADVRLPRADPASLPDEPSPEPDLEPAAPVPSRSDPPVFDPGLVRPAPPVDRTPPRDVNGLRFEAPP